MPYKDPTKRKLYQKKYSQIYYKKNKSKLLKQRKLNFSIWYSRKENKEKTAEKYKKWYDLYRSTCEKCGKKHQGRSLLCFVCSRPRGKDSYLWKGGVSEVNNLIRKSLKYKLWRMKVFKRDNFTCFLCKKRGGDIEAHHKKSFASFPKLRFIIKNGITLCKKCHKNIHTKRCEELLKFI